MLNGISDNIVSLSQLDKYGAINAEGPTKMVYYVIIYIYEPYTLQEDQTSYGQVSKAGEILVKAEYLSVIKSETNWYCKQHGTKHSVIISTSTINRPCL